MVMSVFDNPRAEILCSRVAVAMCFGILGIPPYCVFGAFCDPLDI